MSTRQISSYFADAECAVESARLLRQDRLIAQAQDLLPGLVDTRQMHTVLDIACGPGGWVRDVARLFPSAHVWGIDISQEMLASARLYAKAEALSNVEFLWMDARYRLNFPSDHFDVVNARLLSSFLDPELWPRIITEVRRVLRPGGIARITEFEMCVSTRPAVEQLNQVFSKAMSKTGRSFSPQGRSLGITPMLKPLLQQGGFVAIEQKAFILDCSADNASFADWVEQVKLLVSGLKPFLLNSGVVTESELDILYQQVKEELCDTHFSCLNYFLSVSGQKALSAEGKRRPCAADGTASKASSHSHGSPGFSGENNPEKLS